MGSFDYVVLDNRQNLLALRSYELAPAEAEKAVQNLLKQDRMLRHTYRSLRIGWATCKQTLVPNRLYHSSQQRIYLQQSAELQEDEADRVDELPHLGLRNVYSIAKGLQHALQSHFPGARQLHISTALLNEQRKLSLKITRPSVFLHLRGSRLFTTVFDKGQLLFFNSFRYQSAKDFLYFSLLAFGEANLKPSAAQAILSGPLLEASEIFRQISRYLPQLQFAERPAYFHYGPKVKEEPAYFFFDLLCLSTL